MIPFFSLFGFDFTLTNLGLAGLALLIGFIIGATLKHSLKIVLVLIAVMVIIGIAAPSAVASLNGALALVDPTLWIKEIFSLASASVVVVMFFFGLFSGLWKG